MNNAGAPSQCDRILRSLKSGRVVTPLDALAKFQCFRLAARINELREAGYRIVTGERKLKNGTRVAAYRMGREL